MKTKNDTIMSTGKNLTLTSTARTAATTSFIKQELLPQSTINTNVNGGNMQRLTSFRLPRDLTLGGSSNPLKTRSPNIAGAGKKVYTPNLNAIRNKNTDVKTSRDTSITAFGRGGHGNSRTNRNERGGSNRGRGRGGNTSVVQTAGLFSEGAAGNPLKKAGFFRRIIDNDDPINTLKKPTYIKQETKVDPAVAENQRLEILGNGEDDFNEEFTSSDIVMPIMLSEIKKEKVDNDTPTKTPKTEPQTTFNYPKNLDEFFRNNHPQLFLLQLPDSLPGHGPESEPAESAETDRPITPELCSSYCTVKQLNEGLIGKIVRYKSGKTKLMLGEARYDIDLGMESGVLEDIYSINTNAKERSGNIINLGQVQSKLCGVPDWEFMLSKSSNE